MYIYDFRVSPKLCVVLLKLKSLFEFSDHSRKLTDNLHCLRLSLLTLSLSLSIHLGVAFFYRTALIGLGWMWFAAFNNLQVHPL
jgi:hypothetical protein